uniref:Eugenol O-methyltransferase n=1 Tax=Cajanus cajan TaxID=3821 RepID=A0A151S663_CAJCA|nr:Eugenol O-methyltransferase [Cajanus cajan]
MESLSEEHAKKMQQAFVHASNHCLRFMNTMTVRCAIDLNIPDIIHKYGQPMPLSQLVASLPIHPSKTSFIYRLMRILAHDGFVSLHKDIENEQEVRYVNYL